ncbi:oxygen tolerance domain protein [Kluyvera sp. STS39-E]|uniref:oxygen tolerance domain protein n=1 Tax=Kluyvera sp. STS39-E TaxID=3234748 RepID=UPI0034C66C79
MKLIWLLLLAVLPCQAAMTVARELIAPEHVVPGQPVRVAVTFWTDSWFNPPPQWPDFPVENGDMLTSAPPNQLLTRHEGGTSWSGVRMERQLTAWDQGKLRLPAFEMTLTGSGQAPITVKMPAVDTQVNWPQGVEQPDRFLPASSFSLSQKVNIYRSGKDKTLRAGDVIERIVTARATDVMPAQIPPLLYAINGTHTQRLTPENRLVTSGRGDIEGAERVETLRYLPVVAGEVTLPPIKLRWWDTTLQQWQTAELPGSTYTVAPSRTAGAESALKGSRDTLTWLNALLLAGGVALLVLMFIFRRTLLRSARFLSHRWHRFWQPLSLPGQTPDNRSSR